MYQDIVLEARMILRNTCFSSLDKHLDTSVKVSRVKAKQLATSINCIKESRFKVIGLLTSFTVFLIGASKLKLKNHRYFSLLRR
jgi:hypothetical protein